MNIAVVVAIYKRHDLERIILERLKEQSKKFGFKIVVAGSEGDVSRSLIGGVNYIEVENFPVSKKHNALLIEAKRLNVDGVLLTGSDDLISDEYFEFISNNIHSENVIGLNDLFFYSTRLKELVYFNQWKKGQTIGAGRYFPKKVLDQLDWNLWDEKANKGLDTICSRRLEKNGIREIGYSMNELNCFLIDVKHTRSVTNHAILNNGKKANIEIMAKVKKEKQAIDKLEIEKEITYSAPEYDFSDNEIVIVVCVKDTKHMKEGQEFEIGGSTAKILLNKGLVKIK